MAKQPSLGVRPAGRTTTSQPKKSKSNAPALDPPGTQYIKYNGQTIKVPPGFKWIPPTAGVQSPTIQPFMTGADMLQVSDEQFNLETGLADLDSALERMRADIEFQEGEIDKGSKKAQSDTTDNMIARGLFQSSIKDGDIYDIQATAALRKTYLETTLKNAAIETGTKKRALQTRWQNIQEAMNRRQVENAGAANADAPDYLVDPTPGRLERVPGATPAAPKFKTVQGKSSDGTPGEWHIYPDGRKVFVRKKVTPRL